MFELVRRINSEVIQQAEDIFEHFDARPRFDVVEIPNEYGGNSELRVTFTYTTPHYRGKEVTFAYNPASKTQDGFINEIKAYLLDCVDTFINL